VGTVNGDDAKGHTASAQITRVADKPAVKQIERALSTSKRIAIYGTGEAAELAYLSLKEQGLEPVAIFAEEGGGLFLGIEVRGLDECGLVEFDRLIVATLDKPDALVKHLMHAGIPAASLLTLKPTSLLPAVTEETGAAARG